MTVRRMRNTYTVKNNCARSTGRVRYLSKRLEDMTVVDRIPENQDKVFFGAWVTIEDEEENSKRYRIVGPDEIEAGSDYISMDSPLAKLLLKKEIGDEIWLQKPNGEEIWYEIVAVEYQAYNTDP